MPVAEVQGRGCSAECPLLCCGHLEAKARRTLQRSRLGGGRPEDSGRATGRGPLGGQAAGPSGPLEAPRSCPDVSRGSRVVTAMWERRLP